MQSGETKLSTNKAPNIALKDTTNLEDEAQRREASASGQDSHPKQLPPKKAAETERVREPLARRATGPRTQSGKRKSRSNAVKHGIFAVGVLRGRESRAEYNALVDDLVESLQPVGKLEEILVEKLAITLWRYRRLLQAEAAEIAVGHPGDPLGELPVPPAERRGFMMTASLAHWEKVADRLLRYEGSLERAFDRTLVQLERLQRLRLGQPVPPPIKVSLSA